MIESLLESTMKKVEISDKQKALFTKIHFLLGPEENDHNIEFEFSNEEEAISYLYTEMHIKSIEYLSCHFYEMIENGNYKHFDENIILKKKKQKKQKQNLKQSLIN